MLGEHLNLDRGWAFSPRVCGMRDSVSTQVVLSDVLRETEKRQSVSSMRTGRFGVPLQGTETNFSLLQRIETGLGHTEPPVH